MSLQKKNRIRLLEMRKRQKTMIKMKTLMLIKMVLKFIAIKISKIIRNSKMTNKMKVVKKKMLIRLMEMLKNRNSAMEMKMIKMIEMVKKMRLVKKPMKTVKKRK